jgi:hypothetical protein
VHWKPKFCLRMMLLSAASSAPYTSQVSSPSRSSCCRANLPGTDVASWQAIAFPRYKLCLEDPSRRCRRLHCSACRLSRHGRLAARDEALRPLAAPASPIDPSSPRPVLTGSPSKQGSGVGIFGNSLIKLSGRELVILAGPSRPGKGVVVIPNLLEYQESMAFLDAEQDDYNLTSEWPASHGQ